MLIQLCYNRQDPASGGKIIRCKAKTMKKKKEKIILQTRGGGNKFILEVICKF